MAEMGCLSPSLLGGVMTDLRITTLRAVVSEEVLKLMATSRLGLSSL